MGRWTKGVAAAAGGLLGSAAAAAAIGSRLWDRSTDRAIRRLGSGAAAPRAEVFSADQLQGLPGPVVRYFAFALTPGQPFLRSARVEQTGEFRMGGLDAPWKPFTAVQHYAIDPPGFVWDASIRMAPLLAVRVRDSYIGGAGAMQGKLAALVTVVDQKGLPELNEGALQRYLAEAVWLPTALLPGPGLAWEGIDASTARVTLTDAGTPVSLEFRFGENGAIVGAYTPARYREVKEAYVPTPWEGSYRSYTQVDGMMVPMEGEVAWNPPEGRLAYWRGHIRTIEYAFVR